MKPLLRVFNPVPIDIIDCRTLAQTGQVVAVVQTYEGQALVKTPDLKTDLGMVAQGSLLMIPRKYQYDPNTGLFSGDVN